MPDTALPSQPLRVLCVDDESSVLEMLAALLSRQGYEVATAADGAQALEMVTGEGKVFDVYVTDAAMPRLDGKGFLAAAAQAGCRAHLLVFSASLGATDLDAFQALGVAEIIKKPDLAALLGCVRRYAATF
jgi:CheY-like chemotaxis protein